MGKVMDISEETDAGTADVADELIASVREAVVIVQGDAKPARIWHMPAAPGSPREQHTADPSQNDPR